MKCAYPPCGCEFKPKSGEQRFCSPRCRRAFWTTQEREYHNPRDERVMEGTWSLILRRLHDGLGYDEIAEMAGIEPHSVRRVEGWARNHDAAIARALADCRQDVGNKPAYRRKVDA